MTYIAPVLPPSGTTFPQFQAGGISAMLERLIGVLASGAATANPSAAPTLTTSGTTATLPAATYFSVFTELNAIGAETAPSPVSAGGVVTLGLALTVTCPALQSGNVARNIYVGTAVGGPFNLCTEGLTGSAVQYSAPLPTGGGTPPTANTTAALSTTKLSNLRAAKAGNLQYIYKNLSTFASEWNSGRPIKTEDVPHKLSDFHIVFLALAQLCQEAGTLMDANPGTLGTKAQSLNAPLPVRTWP